MAALEGWTSRDQVSPLTCQPLQEAASLSCVASLSREQLLPFSGEQQRSAPCAPWLWPGEQEHSGQRATLSEITKKLLHLSPYKAIIYTSSYALPRTFVLKWVIFWKCAVEDCLFNVFVYIHSTRVTVCYIWLKGKKSSTGTLSSSAGCKLYLLELLNCF